MVLLSGRKFKAPLIDPFCGSGTLLIEAAMIAKNIAPGLQRKFAFQSFLNFDENLRNDLKNEAQTKIFPHTYQLIGRDIDPTVLTYAKENAERAGVTDTITRQQQSFTPCQGGHPTNSEYLLEGGGAVDPIRLLTNPPYGKRLSADEDLSPLYQQIATTLQQANHYGGVISSYPQLSTLFSPQSFSHKSLYNGADNVEFYWKKPL
jgi:putative N6-adenine-specific DNA methylase